MAIRKTRDGKYRIYRVVNRRTGDEVRYTKRVDAEDYRIRMGGEVYVEDFDTETDAVDFFCEKCGAIWW